MRKAFLHLFHPDIYPIPPPCCFKPTYLSILFSLNFANLRSVKYFHELGYFRIKMN